MFIQACENVHMTSSRHDERMWRVALRLADSGLYPDSRAIEAELAARRFSQAAQLLGNQQAREMLDRRCARAAGKGKYPAE